MVENYTGEAGKQEARNLENHEREGSSLKPGERLFEESMKELRLGGAGAAAFNRSTESSGSSTGENGGNSAPEKHGMGKGAVVRGANGQPEALIFTH